jgi:hypothetical protein
MPASGPFDARARGRSHRARPRIERLETRALLSRTGTTISDATSAAQGEGSAQSRVDSLYLQSLHQHPLVETIVGGSVTKVPMFYANYTGARQPDLDVIGAKGRWARGQGFVFTGKVLGSINSSQSSFYVFGINRGGASGPGPFPGRPMIYFDAEIIVATSPDGFSGTVELLNAKGQPTSSASLPNTAVVFTDNYVQVFVPARLLPSTSPPGTAQPENHYSYAFWAGTSPSAPKGIAGFAPEYANTRVAATGFPPA